MLNNSLYLDVRRILFAHEFVLNRVNLCNYPDGRKHYGFVYCIDGQAEYIFSSGERCSVKRGQVIFLAPTAAYSIKTKKDFLHYTVNFEVHSKTSDKAFMQNEFCLLNTDNPELYRHIFKNLITHWQQKNSCYEMRCFAYLYEIIAHFGSELCEQNYSANAYKRMLPAKEYIDKNFTAQFDLNLLANLTNMSVTNFRREWVKLYNISPMQYRDKIRLDYAKEYLLSGYYTVGEVALKCGFNDLNYFIRFFKKHTGISPRKFTKL
ncbi:MAG: helix-turn-helix transcriptional regulator [Clostridia bacterium]|nr:helix-turn-helix transcriptional regulator [Clostridia bacterium]